MPLPGFQWPRYCEYCWWTTKQCVLFSGEFFSRKKDKCWQPLLPYPWQAQPWASRWARSQCGPILAWADSLTGRTSISSWPSSWTPIKLSAWKSAFSGGQTIRTPWVLLERVRCVVGLRKRDLKILECKMLISWWQEAVFLNLTSRMHELRPESSTKILFYWSFTLLNCYQSTPG